MEVAVHGKQMDVGEALRTHVQDKIEDLNSKYFNHGAYASVTFSQDGHGKKDTKAHITIQLGKNSMVTADGIEKDAYVAFDAAAAKACLAGDVGMLGHGFQQRCAVMSHDRFG